MAELDNLQLGVALKLDDQATAALHRIQGGFGAVAGAADQAGSRIRSFVSNTLSTALGMQIPNALHTISNLWKEVIEAAKGENKELREMASTLMMTAQPGTGWDELRRQAGEYKEKLELASVATGVSAESMIGAFNSMAERSKKPPEELAKFVEQAAVASRIVPSGINGITSGFEMMEMGMIRARNPLVLLIRQAGIMEGSAKQIAHHLQVLASGQGLEKLPKELRKTAEEMRKAGENPVTELAEKAIAIMGERAKSIPLSMGQVLASLRQSKEMFLETLGGPIWKSISGVLMPVLEGWRKQLHDHRSEIEHWATSIGQRVGEWVKDAAKMMQDAFNYLRTHADDILNALERGATALMTAVRFVIANKEILLALAVGSAANGAMGAFGKGGSLAGVASMGRGIAGAAMSAGREFVTRGPASSLLSGTEVAVAGGAVGMLALSAAIVGVGAAAQQASGLLTDLHGHLSREADEAEQNANAIGAYFREMSKGSTLARQWTSEEEHQFLLRRDRMRKEMAAAGFTEAAIEKTMRQVEGQWQRHLQMRERASKMEAMMSQLDTLGTGYRNKAEFNKKKGEWGENVEAIAAYYETAMAQTSEINKNSMLEYLREFIMSHANAQAVLVQAGDKAGKSIMGLAELLAGSSEELANKLKGIGIKLGYGNKPDKPLVDARGSTFNIKQDFRDEDPDRVAIVFQRDLMRATLSPRQSRTSAVG